MRHPRCRFEPGDPTLRVSTEGCPQRGPCAGRERHRDGRYVRRCVGTGRHPHRRASRHYPGSRPALPSTDASTVAGACARIAEERGSARRRRAAIAPPSRWQHGLRTRPRSRAGRRDRHSANHGRPVPRRRLGLHGRGCEPVALLARHGVEGNTIGSAHLFPQQGEHLTRVVAADREDFPGHQSLAGLSRLQPSGQEITEVDDAIHTPHLQVDKDAVQDRGVGREWSADRGYGVHCGQRSSCGSRIGTRSGTLGGDGSAFPSQAARGVGFASCTRIAPP
jgi:hypothetical protein